MPRGPSGSKKFVDPVSTWRGLDRRSDMRPILEFSLPGLACAAALVAGANCHAPTERSQTVPTTSTPAAPTQHGYLPAHGLNYYYEVHGRGEPLLLLHGGLGSINMFGAVLPALARTRQVIAVDLHGHGRTALGDREMSLIDMGDDMAAIVEQLGHRQVDVMGYSLGAGVAFRFAVQHPAAVRRLVLVSTAFAQSGFYPEMLPLQAQVGAAMADSMKGTPMYTSYAAIAPHPEEFPKLLDRLGALMRKPYDWTEDVKRITAQTLLVYGDSDMFRLEHMVEFYKLLGGGQRDAGWMREHMAKNRLAILPNLTHYEIFMSPKLIPTVLPFLEGTDTDRPPVWGEEAAAPEK